MTHSLVCPVCSECLIIESDVHAKGKQAKCKQHHHFDFAKQGYLNLLLSQHKKSKHPGDTVDMVQARTQFLNGGFYEGISRCLHDACIQQLANAEKTTNFNYCDLACGEGFYTHALHHALSTSAHLSGQFEHLNSVGIDISTPAIKAACKRTKDIQWLIASLARIPLGDASQHLVTGLFFHFDLHEIQRILKPGGIFIMVTTGAEHLIELRKEIYDNLKEENTKDFSHITGELTHFKMLPFHDSKTLTSAEDILTLLKMTPHYWRCTQEKKQHLEHLAQLSITIDIQFDIFMRT